MTTDGCVYMMSGASGPWPVFDVDEADIRTVFRDLAEFLAFVRTHLRDAVADLH